MSVTRTLVGLLLLAVAPRAFALDVCRKAKIESDPFDNATTVQMTGRGYSVQLKDAEALFSVDLVRQGLTGEVIPGGSEMAWVLDNGTKITFVSDRPASPAGGAYATQYSAGVYSTWRLVFPVDLATAHAMAGGVATVVRYTLLDEERTIELKPSAARAYQRDFACLAHQLSAAAAP